MSLSTDLKTVETDISNAVAEVKTATEDVVQWIEKVDPSSSPLINQLAADAKAGVTKLATLAAQDASGVISGLVADIETALTNAGSALKLPSTAATEVTATESAGIALLNQAAQAAVSVGLTKILALV